MNKEKRIIFSSVKGKKNLLLLLIFISLLITGAPSCVSDEPSDSEGDIKAGDPLPSLTLTLSNGFHFSPLTIADKVCVITLFTTTCPDCRQELPEVQKLYESYMDNSEVIFAAISREEGAEDIEAYWNANNLTIPWYACTTREIYNKFATSGVPRIYITDRQGVVTVVFSDVAMPGYELLSEELSRALEKN